MDIGQKDEMLRLIYRCVKYLNKRYDTSRLIYNKTAGGYNDLRLYVLDALPEYLWGATGCTKKQMRRLIMRFIFKFVEFELIKKKY